MRAIKEIQKAIEQRDELKLLAGFVISTMRVNFDRGTLTAGSPSNNAELEKIIRSAERRFRRIVR